MKDDNNQIGALLHNYAIFRPIFMAVKKRNGNKLPVAVLNEIRALNDHLARCFGQQCQTLLSNEISKAEGHLYRAMLDTLKYHHMMVEDLMKRSEKLFGYHWFKVGGGEFWPSYSEKKRLNFELFKSAKEAESAGKDDALQKYIEAFEVQAQITQLLEQYSSELKLSWCEKLGRWLKVNAGWLLWTVFGAVISAMVCKFME